MLDYPSDSQFSGTVASSNGKVTNPSLDASDCISKIIEAGNLEQSGDLEAAIALYQEVIELDKDSNYGAIAQKAIETLESEREALKITPEKTIESTSKAETRSSPPSPAPVRLLQRFYNLPIRTKQLATLLTLEVLSVFSVVGVGSWLIINSGQAQLLNQAKSELEVTEINYNSKISQMSLSFQGLAENPIVIQAAANKRSDGEVKMTLFNEVWKGKLEMAVLVDMQRRVVASANRLPSGVKFDPNGLVTKALSSGEKVMATQWISYKDLAADSPRFAQLRAQEMGLDPASKPNFLIRYTVTPVRKNNSQMVGALISGDVVKSPIASETLAAFKDGYSGVYLSQPQGGFALATSQMKRDQQDIQPNVTLANPKLLNQAIAAKGMPVTGSEKLDSQTYTLAAKALPSDRGEPTAILVRGTSQNVLDSLISSSLTWQGLTLLLVLLLGLGLLSLLGQAIVKPVEKLRQVAQAFSSGDRQIRAEAFAQDELGQLTTTFNEMADNIVASEAYLAEQSQQQEAEAERQRQEKERLQQEVVNLLLQIEGAQAGDLTVKGKVTDGIVGSIADAFNMTINKLRDLVLQVKTVSNQVDELSHGGETSVRQLSDAALTQAGEINQALEAVADINTSIQSVATSATEAAQIARQALMEAQEGDVTMDKTVNSIEKIRTTVAGTAKKVKQLAESSQEISQIVGIISAISEKTNLLAFNASVEAARAGEHGQGFRVVADEVRRLADRVTEATKEIQHLVGTIQQETAAVLQAMENSTTEVVTGTELVLQTKHILQGLATTSQEIDAYLQTISSSTLAQTNASQEVNQKMAGVASIAQNTSTEAQDVVQALQTLVEQAQALQSSISQFRLQA